MYRDNSSTHIDLPTPAPQTLYRGLYGRIARELGVDPSYVSRVARGDRRSSQIENALRQALEKIDHRLGRSSSGAGDLLSRPAGAAKRLRLLVNQNRSRIRKQWLAHSQSDPNLRRVKLADQKRAAPILPVLEETMKAMKLSLKGMANANMKAAEQHGRLRQAQGFTAMALVEEYNLVRRCVFGLAQEHCRQMDTHLLIQDLTQFGEALDLQTQRALRDYLASA
jgi:transcriptional regulator with XRE-family HTH domain